MAHTVPVGVQGTGLGHEAGGTAVVIGSLSGPLADVMDLIAVGVAAIGLLPGNPHASRGGRGIAVAVAVSSVGSVAGLSRPLAIVTTVAESLGRPGCVADTAVGVVGQGRSIATVGSRPLANVMVGGVVSTESLGATAGVAGAGGMEGHAGGVAGLRLPLAQAVVAGQALHTPTHKGMYFRRFFVKKRGLSLDFLL